MLLINSILYSSYPVIVLYVLFFFNLTSLAAIKWDLKVALIYVSLITTKDRSFSNSTYYWNLVLCKIIDLNFYQNTGPLEPLLRHS